MKTVNKKEIIYASKAKKSKQTSILNSSFWSNLRHPFVILLIAITIPFYFYLFYIAFRSERNLIPLTMITLISGLMYQSFKITKSIEKIIIYLMISAFLSLLAFAQGDNKSIYVFVDHLEFWVYCYLFIFLLIMSIQHDKQMTLPFGEGLSLLFCLAFLYWLFENHLIDFSFIFTQILSVIAILVTAFSVLHALFKIKHKPSSRFILSISSCIAIVILSIDNLFQLMNQSDLGLNKTWTENLILLIQYFLLGVSALFLFQNVMLLLQYLPNRYTRSYFSDIKQNSQTHIKRFSEDQISWIEAVFCLCISIFAYTLNYYFRIIPPNMCIWLIIFLCPLLIQYLFAHSTSMASEINTPLKNHSVNSNNRQTKRKKTK